MEPRPVVYMETGTLVYDDATTRDGNLIDKSGIEHNELNSLGSKKSSFKNSKEKLLSIW